MFKYRDSSFFGRLVRRIVRENQARGIKQRLQDSAWEEAATFIRNNWNRDCEFFEDWWSIRKHSLLSSPPQGLLLEFGVHRGNTINYFSKILTEQIDDRSIYGFDNFTGLVEPWTGTGLLKSHFNRSGAPPDLSSNVEIVIGDIEDTLEPFLRQRQKERISFVHIDTDTYSPCKLILDLIKPHITVGSVLLFDQFIGYLGYQEHEFAALNESFDKESYKFIAFGIAQEKSNFVKAAIKITQTQS